ncbi:hypothetical protein HDV06_006994 [Boothiomyces sp. JEL0866]|nr:hypothetical protein HDV06_006994 [Boothiomyces sp. JEL0866]
MNNSDLLTAFLNLLGLAYVVYIDAVAIADPGISCSNSLKKFFIGSIIAYVLVTLTAILTAVIKTKRVLATITQFSYAFWGISMVWAFLGIYWVKTASDCNDSIMQAANNTLIMLFLDNVLLIILEIIQKRYLNNRSS